jgi:hypothetical protein
MIKKKKLPGNFAQKTLFKNEGPRASGPRGRSPSGRSPRIQGPARQLNASLYPHKDGAPDTIRTCGLCLRRATLYPAELRVLIRYWCALLGLCLASRAWRFVQASQAKGSGVGGFLGSGFYRGLLLSPCLLSPVAGNIKSYQSLLRLC